ncbi:MAG: T9SS type A sorting domain-containing protein, partial [Bacteroidetes bacterium]|nr:T9SS type A sorting domain-containing protein [Bacteroidota bacterium]
SIDSEDVINIYPNPAKHFCHIDLDFSTPKKVTIELLDLTGRPVYSYHAGKISGEQITLNLADFSRGIYLLKITSGDKVATKKLIIEK